MDLGSYYPRVIELQQQERYQDALKVLEEGVANEDPMSAWYLWEQMNDGVWMKRDPDRLKTLTKKFEKKWEPFRLLVNRAREMDYDEEEQVVEPLLKQIEIEALKQNDPVLFFTYYELSERATSEAFDEKARGYLLKSAKMGYAVAQDALSEEDRIHNIYWTRKAAEQGHPMCMWSLGLRLFKEEKFAAAKYWIWRLITETQEGKTTGRAAAFWNENIQVFKKLRHCKDSMITFLGIRKYRESVLSVIPKDVVVLIAKELWKTNQEECWDNQEVRKKIKV